MNRISLNLNNRKLIFVMGKGGTGKSTMSVALSFAVAKMGKKALITEIGENDSIGSIFDIPSISDRPRKLNDMLWAARINPRRALEDYISHHIGFSFLTGAITGATLFDHFFQATPGLKEIMTLGQVWRWTKEKDQNNGDRFDTIVVDSPATGHGLSLLRQPKALMDMLRVGPIAEEVHNVRQLMEDRKKTGIVLVTLPEELSVNETLECIESVHQDLNMEIDGLVINMTYEDLFTENERRDIVRVYETIDMDDIDRPEKRIFDVAVAQMKMREHQRAHIQKLYDSYQGPIIEVPFYFCNRLTVGENQEMAGFFKSQ